MVAAKYIIVLMLLTCLPAMGGGLEYHHYTADEVRQYMPTRVDLIGCVWWFKYHEEWSGDTHNYDEIGEKPPYFVFTMNGYPAGTTNFGFKNNLMAKWWTRMPVYRQKITWTKYTYTAPLWPGTEVTEAFNNNRSMFFKSMRSRTDDVIKKIVLIEENNTTVIYDSE